LLKKIWVFLYPVYSYYIRGRHSQYLGWERSIEYYEDLLYRNHAKILESGELLTGEKYFIFKFTPV
jgi:hypothetical protein